MYVFLRSLTEVVGLISDPDRSSMRYVLKDALSTAPSIYPSQAAMGLDQRLDMNTGKLLWQRPNSRTPEEIKSTRNFGWRSDSRHRQR
ncbi:MAG: hypothetical protein CM15mP103_11210 [Gammaproteobacteria bacterium]|nr:MAG: hypothetical protein CM15mP103_11210 [Gammaproteobacteria bacterium]